MAEASDRWSDADRTLRLACTYELGTSPSYLLDTPWMEVDDDSVTLMDLEPLAQLRLLKPPSGWRTSPTAGPPGKDVVAARLHIARMAGITRRIAAGETHRPIEAPMSSEDLREAVLAKILNRIPEEATEWARVTVMIPCPEWPLSAHIDMPFAKGSSRRVELLSQAESETWTPLCEPVIRVWWSASSGTTISYNGTVSSTPVTSIGSDPMASMRLMGLLDELSNNHGIEENGIEAPCAPKPVDPSGHPR